MRDHKVPLSLLTVVLLASCAEARPKLNDGIKPKQALNEEQTCGQEISAAAEVPEGWQQLMDHVATNMEWHAGWVGAGSSAAKREHDALVRVAVEYRAMAAAAARAATAMRAMHELPPAPHDPSKLDRAAQAQWMRAKIQMQRDFAGLLTRHAEDSEKALAELETPMDQ
jgi:hypothetical protein